MDLSKLLDGLVSQFGVIGVQALKDEVDDLVKEASTPWKKTILAMTSNAVEAFGIQGVAMAQKALHQILDGGDVPDLTWADLEVQSDILTQLQNAEADQKNAAKDFMTKAGHLLGQIFGGFVKGIISSIA